MFITNKFCTYEEAFITNGFIKSLVCINVVIFWIYILKICPVLGLHIVVKPFN